MSSALFRKSAEEIFSSATLTIDLGNDEEKQAHCQEEIERDGEKTTKDNNCHFLSTYFVDTSSRRAQIVLPAILHFDNEYERQRLIQSGAVQPSPKIRSRYNSDYNGRQSNYASTDRKNGNHDDNQVEEVGGKVDEAVEEEEDQEQLWDAELDMIGEIQDDDFELGNRSTIRFECLIHEKDEVANQDKQGDEVTPSTCTTIIESVRILSTFLVDTTSDIGIGFNVEVSLCCDIAPCDDQKKEKDVPKNDEYFMTDCMAIRERTRMELRALLHSNMDLNDLDAAPSSSSWNRSRMGHERRSSMANQLDIPLGLHALEMAIDAATTDLPALVGNGDSFVAGATHDNKNDISSATVVYSVPSSPLENAPCIELDIASALHITVHEITATPTSSSTSSLSCSDGNTTLVSLTLEHSNVHDENVTITGISLHTSHSRLLTNNVVVHSSTVPVSNRSTLQGGEHATMDMTPNVTWGYVPGTAPPFPLILEPRDAYSTILRICAREVYMGQRGRDFVSPIVVRGIVGGNVDGSSGGSSNSISTKVMACADVRWTTASFVNVASMTVDALEVMMSVDEAICQVGKQVLVRMKVVNLGEEVKDLRMEVLMGSSGMLQEEQKQDDEGEEKNGNISPGNPIMVQVGEYSFGCYGLVGTNDGKVQCDCDDALLAVDDTLYLGEIKGQQCIESVLRFIPLKEGTLSVPNLKFFDRIRGACFRCDHSLKIISVTTGP